MWKVLVTAPYMIADRDQVASLFPAAEIEVTWAEVVERLGESELLDLVEPFHAILCGDDAITARVLERARQLRAIVKWGTGIDSIDSAAARARGVAVRRTPGAFSEPVADTTVGLMLSHLRAIAASDRAMKQGRWHKVPCRTLASCVVGIIGLGDVGSTVARRLSAFGCRVLANDIAPRDPELVRSLGVTLVDKDAIYAGCDIITLHCDLNPTSHHLVNPRSLAAMQRQPFVINTARGPIVDEPALVQALQTGQVSGAGLDVFEVEPLPATSPLLGMTNVFLSPHNANSSPLHRARVHENSLRMLLEELHRA